MENKNIEKIFDELFNHPNYKFHIRELARATSLNPNTIINLTDKLEKEGLVIKRSKKHLVEISLNLENKKTFEKRKLFNLSKIQDSGLIEFLEKEFNHPEAIILFGSFARADNIEKSDVDIAIISSNKKELNLNKFERKVGHEIQIFVFSRKEIMDIQKHNKELLNNIINGVTLSGYLQIL